MRSWWDVVVAKQANQSSYLHDASPFLVFYQGHRFSGQADQAAFTLSQFDEYGIKKCKTL